MPARFEAAATPAREAYLLIRHLGGLLMQELAEALDGEGLTPEQYHILRILRDAEGDGLPCSVVAARAVSGDPDVTRLLDRLESRDWATRERDTADRRVVRARITKEGARLLKRVDAAVTTLHARQFAALDRGELAALRELLGRVASREG